MDDYEGIRRTLAQYCQLLDDGHFDEWSDLFASDAVFMPPGSVIKGREAIRAWPYAFFTAADVAMGRHLTTNEIIDIEGDTAKVHADILVMLPTAQGPLPALIGQYHDVLVRNSDRWRFSKRQVVTQSQEWLASVLGATATGPLK